MFESILLTDPLKQNKFQIKHKGLKNDLNESELHEKCIGDHFCHGIKTGHYLTNWNFLVSATQKKIKIIIIILFIILYFSWFS